MSHFIPHDGAPPSTRTLARAIALALTLAVVVLATVVLPAEYGIDPTGVGRVLGLTQMGQIKVRLAREAAEHAAEEAAIMREIEAESDSAAADSSAVDTTGSASRSR